MIDFINKNVRFQLFTNVDVEIFIKYRVNNESFLSWFSMRC